MNTPEVMFLGEVRVTAMGVEAWTGQEWLVLQYIRDITIVRPMKIGEGMVTLSATFELHSQTGVE